MRPAKGEPLIDQDRMINEAWALVEEEGLAGLSSRKLATRLGVSGPALYHHIRSMNELYGMMIERLLSEARARTRPCTDWREWISELATNHCRILLAHRDSGRITALSQPTDAMRNEVLPDFSAPLMEAGLSQRDALAATGALGSFILGYIVNMQHEGHRELANSVHRASDSLSFAIEAFVDALSKRVEILSA